MVLASFVLFIILVSSLSLDDGVRQYISNSTFNLLDDAIADKQTDKRKQLIKHYQQSFGPELGLFELDTLKIDSDAKKNLIAGKVAVTHVFKDEFLTQTTNPPSIAEILAEKQYDDEIIVVWRRYKNTSKVWRIHLDISFDYEELLKSKTEISGGQFIEGTFDLIAERLRSTRLNNQSLESAIDTLKSRFELPLSVLTQQQLNAILNNPQLAKPYKNNKAITFSENAESTSFIHAFERQALQIGPLEIPWLVRNYLWIFTTLFAFSIAFALFVWLWPLWSNLLKIKKAALA